MTAPKDRYASNRPSFAERWVVPATYRCLALFARVAVRTYFPRITVAGAADIPRRGGLIIVSNHLDYADPGVLLARVPRRAVFLAMKDLFDWPVVGLLPRLLGALPVDPRRAEIASLRAALRALDQGLALIVFPEGERSKTGGLQRGFAGAALLAYHAGVPIVPVAITGTERPSWPWVLLLPLLGPKVTVRFGAPFRLAPVERVDTRAAEVGIDLIMRRIAELLPAAYRGMYGGGTAS
jgi:1-acyl-sn-glycerol-3-phosphate acyltransferase